MNRTAKVVNYGPNALCLYADVPGRGTVEINLEVAATYVDEELLAAVLEASEICDALFAKQCRLVTEQERPADECTHDLKAGRVPADLSKLKLKAALAAIAACEDPQQLRAWVLTDARREVRKALHLRDRELRPAELDETKVSTAL